MINYRMHKALRRILSGLEAKTEERKRRKEGILLRRQRRGGWKKERKQLGDKMQRGEGKRWIEDER